MTCSLHVAMINGDEDHGCRTGGWGRKCPSRGCLTHIWQMKQNWPCPALDLEIPSPPTEEVEPLPNEIYENFNNCLISKEQVDVVIISQIRPKIRILTLSCLYIYLQPSLCTNLCNSHQHMEHSCLKSWYRQTGIYWVIKRVQLISIRHSCLGHSTQSHLGRRTTVRREGKIIHHRVRDT